MVDTVPNTDSDSGGSSFAWSTSPPHSAATEETNHEGPWFNLQRYKQGVFFVQDDQSHLMRDVWGRPMESAEQQASRAPIIRQPRLRPNILHDIALRHILEAVFPPSDFLNPALSLGPDSPWSRALRCRKALTMVCKQWRDVALPLLYRDVVLRRAGQITALQRTVSSNPELFGPMIKSITALCYVPRTLRTAAMTRLSMIMDNATYLRSVSWGPIFISTVDLLPASAVDTIYTALFTRVDTLTQFEYNQSLRREIAFPRQLLIGLQNLTHVTIFMPKVDPPYPARPFVHDSIKVLRFVYMNGDNADADMSAFCTWILPALEQVHFRPFVDFSGPPRGYTEFLISHPHISMLDLGCWPVINFGVDEAAPTRLYTQTQQALEAFTAFRHLVIPARIGKTHILDTTLATFALPHVDLWTSVGDPRLDAVLTPQEHDPDDEELEDFQKHWRSVRMIDNGLSTVLDVPRLLSPADRPAPGVTEVHDIFGMAIHETHAYIARRDHAWGPSDADVPYDAPGALANIYAYVSEDEHPDTSSSEDSDGDVRMSETSSDDSQDSDVYAPPEDVTSDSSDEWSDEDISEGELNDVRSAWFEDYGTLPAQLGLEELGSALDDVDDGYLSEDEGDDQ